MSSNKLREFYINYHKEKTNMDVKLVEERGLRLSKRW